MENVVIFILICLNSRPDSLTKLRPVSECPSFVELSFNLLQVRHIRLPDLNLGCRLWYGSNLSKRYVYTLNFYCMGGLGCCGFDNGQLLYTAASDQLKTESDFPKYKFKWKSKQEASEWSDWECLSGDIWGRWHGSCTASAASMSGAWSPQAAHPRAGSSCMELMGARTPGRWCLLWDTSTWPSPTTSSCRVTSWGTGKKRALDTSSLK